VERREFLRSLGAAVAASRGAFGSADRDDLAARDHLTDGYDLLITGGRVVDPASSVDAVRDIAITSGRIVAVQNRITPDARQTIDARGKLVVPGLLDVHTHVADTAGGARIVLGDGVTGWIDAGSKGADRIADVIAAARRSPQPGRVLINIGRGGLLPDGDTMDLRRADVAAAREAIANNRDVIVGIKARLSREVCGDHDQEVLRRAKKAAEPFGIPVMIHMGQSMSPLPKLLELLSRGDIVSHMYAPAPNGILDENGRILPAVHAARRRGIIFDVGNGRTRHIRWDVVEAAIRQGFRPDTISTDWTASSPTTGVVNLANCMSKFLHYGMSEREVVACTTLNASRLFAVFKDRGTLAVGAPADVALLEPRDGTFEFLDNYDNTIIGRRRLFPAGTVLGGKLVEPQAAEMAGHAY